MKKLMKIAALTVAFTIIGSASVFAQERKIPIYSVETPEKKLSISFDAAWGADDTDTLLGILKKHNVLTTFFF